MLCEWFSSFQVVFLAISGAFHVVKETRTGVFHIPVFLNKFHFVDGQGSLKSHKSQPRNKLKDPAGVFNSPISPTFPNINPENPTTQPNNSNPQTLKKHFPKPQGHPPNSTPAALRTTQQQLQGCRPSVISMNGLVASCEQSSVWFVALRIFEVSRSGRDTFFFWGGPRLVGWLGLVKGLGWVSRLGWWFWLRNSS